jgi:spermidine synthase
MRLSDPYQLQLPYVRAMVSWLIFKESLTDEALLVGLGGGSLTRHLLQHFPECKLKVVEYRRDVVKIARSHFDLPLDSRLKIIVDDGARYIRLRTDSHRERYSLLFIDAFDDIGMAESIRNEAFFDACKAILKSDGMMIINLWGGTNNPEFQQIALWLGRIFDWKVLFLPVQDRGNIIGLAFNDTTQLYSLKTLRLRAIELEQRYQIEFPVFLRDLVKHNASIINNTIKN